MEVILYTIGCSSCDVLEKKLQQAGIEFVKVSDEKMLIQKGFENKTFPILEVNGIEMSYKTAIEWINNIE